MEKKTIIILSLISIVLSLLYLLLEYYGLSRFCALHLYPCEPYIKEYSKLEHASKERVIIVLLTTVNKLKKIKPVISSLLDQTVKVNEINILLSEKKNKEIPKYLYKVANFYYNCKGFSSLVTKERDKNTKIIVVNDEYVYGKDFVETILAASNSFPSNIISIENNKFNYAILLTPDDFNEDCQTCDCLSSWLKRNLNKINIIEYKEIYKKLV